MPFPIEHLQLVVKQYQIFGASINESIIAMRVLSKAMRDTTDGINFRQVILSAWEKDYGIYRFLCFMYWYDLLRRW